MTKLDISLPDVDDRGVSPVIGVILMVAITIILAAVIGSFVLNFNPGANAAPSASWTVDQNQTVSEGNFTVTFTHNGGEDVESDALSFAFPDNSSSTNVIDDDFGSGTLSAGDSATVTIENATVGVGDRVQLVWSGGDQSTVLRSYNLQ